MPDDDPIDRLARAIDETQRVVEGIRSEQSGLPTPCPDWDVRALLNHLVRDLRMFTARTTGAPVDGDEGADLIGEDWPAAYRRAADDLVAAWRRAGLDRTVSLPFGDVPAAWLLGQHVSDVVVHGWDLARATGQPVDFDRGVAAYALDWARGALRPELRGREFGPEVPVPEDAPMHDRLAAFFGRDPGWSPTSG